MSRSQASAFNETLALESGNSEWLTIEKVKTLLEIVIRSSTVEHAVLASALFGFVKQYNDQRVANKSLADEFPSQILPDLIRALTIGGKDQDALTLCTAAGVNHKQPLVLWNGLLTSYRDAGDLAGFLRARDFMMIHRLLPDIAILNMQLELLNAGRMYQDALALYSSLPSDFQVAPDWRTRLIMLDVCMNAESHEDMEGLSADLEKCSKEVYARLRNDLKGHAEKVYPKVLSWIVFKRNSLDVINDEVRKMEQSGLELNIEIVNSMLFAATVSKQWLLLERLWSSLRSRSGLFPTESTFSLRIAASVMGGDKSGANAIFEESKSAGFADMVDPLALQTLLAAEMMGEHTNEELCKYLLQLLEKIQPFPITPTTLKFLIPKLLERKDFARVERIIEMSQARVDWDTRQVIEIILEQVAEAKDEKSVMNDFILLKNLFWEDPIYDLKARETLLRQAIKVQSGQKAVQMFTQLLTSRIKPDEHTYNMMLKGGITLKDFDMVRRIHQCMKMDINLSQHTSILNTLMMAYSHLSSTLAFDVWEQISRSGRGPTQASVSIVLDTCTYARLPVKGQHIWRILERSDFALNDNNYASYVEMLNKHNMTNEALSTLTLALEQRRPVGVRAVSTLYNTAADKKMVEHWALSQCPKIWHSIPRK